MALTTYPLNDIDYAAEDAELFNCPRTSGIYAGEDFAYSVTGADNTITVGTGLGWIRNGRFAGKVIALKSALALDMGLPDATYPRIDAVVIRFDANANATDIVAKQGTAASDPAAPEVTRTEAVYELHLYHVRREAGAATITAADITDLRLDGDYCGLMADAITSIDTDAINAQAMALIEQLRAELQSAKDETIYALKEEVTDMAVAAVTLSAAGWSGNAQTVAVAGVLADGEKQAVITTAAAGSLEVYLDCGVVCSGQGDGTLTFTCSDTPTADITVNVLMLTKGVTTG